MTTLTLIARIVELKNGNIKAALMADCFNRTNSRIEKKVIHEVLKTLLIL